MAVPQTEASKPVSNSTKLPKSGKQTKTLLPPKPATNSNNNKENNEIDNSTAPTDYLSSSDEDSVAAEEEEPAKDDSNIMETRGNKKRAAADQNGGKNTKKGGRSKGDNDKAAQIAELKKKLDDLTKNDVEEKDPKQGADFPALLVRRLTKEEAAAQQNKEVSKLVRGATKSHIWRTQKFVKDEVHLDKLTAAVMDILAIPWTSFKGIEEGTYAYNQVLLRRDEFVATYRDDVRKEINEKRSYTMVSLRW